MNRFYSVFMVVVTSCSFAFSQTTNIVDATLAGSGDYPDNYAAKIKDVNALNVSGSTLTGGLGGTTTESVSIITDNGGAGLLVENVGLSTVSDSEFHGGNGGTVTVDVSSNPEANAGHGIELSASSGQSDLSLATGVVATGGSGGTINNGSGKGKAFGGDGVHVNISGDSPADMIVAEGTYQGGTGGSASFSSNTKEAFLSTILSGVQNGARGGHGLYVFENFMYRDAARSLSITNGSFTGGAGGVAVNSDTGDVIAYGGSGIYVGSVSDVKISGGTFVGGAAGTTNGVAAQGGFGATFWDSNIEISDGDFKGGAGGLLYGSIYYDSTATISSGRFDSVEFRTITTDISGFQGYTTANVSGGDLGMVTLSGDAEVSATFTGGSLGDLYFSDSGIKNISIGAGVASSGKVIQYDGVVNIDEWADHHFENTTIHDGAMNFSGQSFNLTGGSSLALLSSDSAVDFAGGFTAQSNSQITTTYDGTTHSTVKGGAMVFEEGVKWTIDGVSTIANGTTITMASGGSSMVSGLLDSDVEYVGGSWAAGLSVNAVGDNLIGTYGFRDLQDGLGLTPGTEFYKAMDQLSVATDFANSSDNQFTALKDPNLSQEDANNILQEQFVNNQMVGALIQLQGMFADQIKDRTRSHLRYKDWGSPARSPQGAQGPDYPSWDARSTLKSMDENAPSWDVSQSMRNMDDKAPRWDVSQSMRNADDKAPKSASIKVPVTYQVWGRGYGTYLEQDDTSGLTGYDATMGGAVLGLDKRFNNLLLGLGGGYAKTRLNGNGGGEDEADTLYGTAYAGVTGEKWFLDFNVNYAFNDVETVGSPVAGSYEGDYNADTFSAYLGGGWGFSTFNDSVLFTPEASLLATYYMRDSYMETPTSTDPGWVGGPELAWDSYNQLSCLSSLGATLSSIHQFENFNLEMELQPEIRLHWLHEFNADMDNDSYIMGGNTTPIGVAIQAREEDLVKVGTGVRFSKWGSEALEFGLDLDGVFGKGYEAYIVSGKLMHRF